ncbi:MAG: hypothetical protein AAGK02_01750 [Pseudomonadota bacterium]
MCGLSVAVLPSDAVIRAAGTIGLGSLGGLAQLAMATIAAILGGIAACAIALMIKNGSDYAHGTVADRAYSRVKSIDPSADLGSESLDTPIDEQTVEAEQVIASSEATDLDETFEPDAALVDGDDVFELTEADEAFVGDDAWIEPEARAEEDGDEETPLELNPFDASEKPPEEIEASDATISDSGQPKVEASIPFVDNAAPTRPAEAPDIVKGAAIESLREIPTEDLSLIQMVERFAAALHEHHAIHGPNGGEQRDAALADSA